MRTESPHALLAVLLSATAGAVDLIGYQRLGLFTAHITGNIVVIGAELVTGAPPKRLQTLAVPVFAAAVAATWLAAKMLTRRGIGLARPLLLVQCLLLAGVLLMSVVDGDAGTWRDLMQGLAAMLAVSAMACQFAILRMALPGTPSTAVMSGNLTQIVLSALDMASERQSQADVKAQLASVGRSFVGFFLGCTAGALAVWRFQNWAWTLPVVMAALAALMPASTAPNRVVDGDAAVVRR